MAEQMARIYRLLCEDGHYYIGATTQPLLLRLKNHKHLSKTTLNKVYTHLNKVGWDHITIELVEECLSTEKKTRLQHHIDSHKDDSLCLSPHASSITKSFQKHMTRVSMNIVNKWVGRISRWNY